MPDAALPVVPRLSKLSAMETEIGTVEGKPLRLPPGRLAVKLTPAQALAYRTLYGRYGTVLAGLPVLRERDLAGRRLTLRRTEVEALNAAFAKLQAAPDGGQADAAFSAQERSKNRLSKRLQHLS